MTTLLRDRLASLGKLPKKLNYGDKIVIDGKTYVKAHLKSELDDFIKWGWGERCETSDLEDFPELKDDPLASRCAACEMYEHLDEFRKRVE